MDKLQKWALIEEQLIKAFNLLPSDITESDFGYRKEDFLEYIRHNEFRLAMEELDGVVEDNPAPRKEFWQHLINAAEIMGNSRVQKYRTFLDVT